MKCKYTEQHFRNHLNIKGCTHTGEELRKRIWVQDGATAKEERGELHTHVRKHLQSGLKVHSSFVLLQKAMQETARGKTNVTLKKSKLMFCKCMQEVFHFVVLKVAGAIPVILSWVLGQAEQRLVLLEAPLVRPARSWMVLNLCVHLSLPAERRQGQILVLNIDVELLSQFVRHDQTFTLDPNLQCLDCVYITWTHYIGPNDWQLHLHNIIILPLDLLT